jgi:hypothetical protein
MTTGNTKPLLPLDEIKDIATQLIADQAGYEIDAQYVQDLGRDDLLVVRHRTDGKRDGTLWIDLALDRGGVPMLEAAYGPDDGMKLLSELIDAQIRRIYAERLTESLKAHAGRHVFRQVGDSWYVAFGNEAGLVKHTLGMTYISQLLANPTTEYPAMELYQTFNPAVGDEDAAGRSLSTEEMEGMHIDTGYTEDRMIDKETRTRIRQHIDDLKRQRAKALEEKNFERANELAAEIMRADKARHEYLSQNTRFGGMSRRMIDNQERARNAVRKAITDAIDHMDATPGLQNHLRKSIYRRDRVSYVVGGIKWET